MKIFSSKTDNFNVSLKPTRDIGDEVLTSTHNLSFGSKIIKNNTYTLVNRSLLYKSGVQGGVHGHVFLMIITLL